jgi:hypothetical protein
MKGPTGARSITRRLRRALGIADLGPLNPLTETGFQALESR